VRSELNLGTGTKQITPLDSSSARHGVCADSFKQRGAPRGAREFPFGNSSRGSPAALRPLIRIRRAFNPKWTKLASSLVLPKMTKRLLAVLARLLFHQFGESVSRLPDQLSARQSQTRAQVREHFGRRWDRHCSVIPLELIEQGLHDLTPIRIFDRIERPLSAGSGISGQLW
jgi:hypothetical protein